MPGIAARDGAETGDRGLQDGLRARPAAARHLKDEVAGGLVADHDLRPAVGGNAVRRGQHESAGRGAHDILAVVGEA